MIHNTPDELSTERRISELLHAYPLPAGWSLEDTLIQRTSIGRLELHMVGLVAARTTESALGAAAESAGFPVDRAFFELLERISMYEARRSPEPLCVRDTGSTELAQRAVARVFPTDLEPNSRRLSLSNGVAVHESWPLACSAAQSELIERDRVLRAWSGQCPVIAVEPPSWLSRALAPLYRVAACEFGSCQRALKHRVAGLFLFPHVPAPLVYGFASHPELPRAITLAEREALQRLAFLWGEPLPEVVPAPVPTPEFHQDYYLYAPHAEHLRAWVDNRRYVDSPRNPPLYDGELTHFVDLTPPAFRGRLAVAKASSPHARRLRFGTSARVRHRAPHPIV